MAAVSHKFVTIMGAALTIAAIRSRSLRSRPQIEIALRLQFGNPDHATFVGGNEARQQIGEPDLLGLHRVAAGGELKAGFGELADMSGQIGFAEDAWNARSAWP